MKIVCPNCQKTYRIDPAKISSGVSATICKSCRTPIPLKQADKSPRAPSEPKATIEVTCRNCHKKYRIRRQKIPAHAKAVRCKACGQKIAIKQDQQASIPAQGQGPQPKESKLHDPEQRQPGHPLFRLDLKPEVRPGKIYRPRKKIWVIAAAVCVLVVIGVLLWMYSGSAPINKNQSGAERISQTQTVPQSNIKAAQGLVKALTETPKFHLKYREMDLKPSRKSVETRYIAKPVIAASVDVGKLKKILASKFEQSLFPGHFWAGGNNPRMTLSFDPIDIPNAAAAELTYDVISINSTDGKNVLLKQKGNFSQKIYPGRISPGNISLPIQKGIPPEALATAKIRFHLSLPVELQMLEFKAGNTGGNVKNSDNVSAELIRLEKDVAKVAFRGGRSAKLFAVDRTGQTLAPAESISSAVSVSTRFQGLIENLKVVVARRIHEYPFEIEIDLNGGKTLTLPKTPGIPARIRYDHRPVADYPNFTTRDLINLNVIWTEKEESSSTDNLTVILPKGPFSSQAVWEVHFFGNDKPEYLPGNSFQGLNSVSYRMDKGALAKANSAFGRVRLDLDTGIQRLRFINKSDNRTITQVLPAGEKISLTYNKNEITINPGKAKIVQVAAYDARDKRLRQDHFTGNKDGNRKLFFWGVPTALDLDLATAQLTEIIEFEIGKRPVNRTAYQAFRQEVENQREIVTILKKIDRARSRDPSYYGDNLAGLYYLHDRKNKKPMALIDIRIAHSDPAGQARFGYTLEPYKGYYFTVLAGTETNGTPKPYPRQAKKAAFKWEKGIITTAPYVRRPDLIAIPEDPSQPSFFLQSGPVFMKLLNGEKINYLPENYYTAGWVEAKFVGE
jgi:predicted Zn finger-like uncharacterized protein